MSAAALRTGVTPDQRYTRWHPCPICEGYASLPAGHGERCAGYLSADTRYAHCTREERAGDIQPTSANPPTYAHRLDGPCRCGMDHSGGSATLPPRPLPARRPPVQTRYEMVDATGTVVGIHCRADYLGADGRPCRSKRMWWESHGGRSPTAMPLYGLPALLRAAPDGPVYLTEGERACDALLATGVLAVGTGTGASATPCDEALRPLVGRPVILWPDNDPAGTTHMQRIAARLVALGADPPRWVVWPDAPPKGDAVNYLASGGTVEELAALVQDTEPHPSAPLGILLADVQPERVRWLWPGRIPLGKLTVVDGDPGLGKSLLAEEIAARTTQGDTMPDGTPGIPGGAGVVLLSAEDGLADTIRPRLEAAGADLTRVLALTGVPTLDPDTGQVDERDIMLPDDLPTIERAAERIGAALIVIDPLMAYLSGEVNAHRDQDVRRALRQMAAVAERTGAAVVVIRHLNKMAGANALYRGGGSIGIVGAARSALLVAPDPDDAERRIVAVSKRNLAGATPSLAYRIVEAAPGVPRIQWDGESPHTPLTLLSAPVDSEARSATADAMDWLRDQLADGAKGAKVVADAAAAADISPKALRSARERLCSKPRREGGLAWQGQWVWELLAPSRGDGHLSTGAGDSDIETPHDDAKMPTNAYDAHSQIVGALEGGGHLSTEGNPDWGAA